jgi:dolichol-phosphate mannosyltransferase
LATPGLAPTESASVLSPLIRERWACPRCHEQELRETGAAIVCRGCGAAYASEDGIPLFLTPAAPSAEAPAYDLTVVVLTLNERENVRVLLPDIHRTLGAEALRYELMIMDGGSTDGTREVAESLGATAHVQQRRGYGGAVEEALRIARGRHVLMMDADLSHPAPFLTELWRARSRGDLVVASRYVPGARFDAPWIRKVLSRILNVTFTRFLDLPVRDVSSGFRLYRTAAFRDIPLEGTNFETLEELLIKAHVQGRSIGEIPFNYEPRREGHSHVHFVKFAICFLRMLHRMWALRSRMEGADYEDRAAKSKIPLQRYWHWKRQSMVRRFMGGVTGAILNVGCGSSRMVAALPGSIGVDPHLPKLRYLKQRGQAVLQGSIFELPIASASVDGVVCTQVVEHVAPGPRAFAELSRVLKPGGLAVVGTLDYGRPYWPALEHLYRRIQPDSEADVHLARYTRATLFAHLEAAGFDVVDFGYVLGSELNVLARKR